MVAAAVGREAVAAARLALATETGRAARGAPTGDALAGLAAVIRAVAGRVPRADRLPLHTALAMVAALTPGWPFADNPGLRAAREALDLPDPARQAGSR